MIALKHIRRDRDRHGNIRIYLRVPGRKQVRLREPPGSAAFLRAYEAALSAAEGGPPQQRHATAPRGSLAAAWAAWRASPEFADLAPRTRHVRALILAPLLAEHGAKPLAALSARHVQALRDTRADRPGAANGLLKILRQLLTWAARHQLVERNVAVDVPYLRSARPGGFRAWTHADLATFRSRWPIGGRPRLALELLVQTGVRRSDVVRLGPPLVRGGFIVLTEAKNARRAPKVTEIPLLASLTEIIKATPAAQDHLVWLTTESGKPYTLEGFSNWFRRCCRDAGLADCPAHGLRKLAAATLADAGATPHQLMAWFGWTTSRMAEGYTRGADRRKLAGDARRLLEAVPPPPLVGQPGAQVIGE